MLLAQTPAQDQYGTPPPGNGTTIFTGGTTDLPFTGWGLPLSPMTLVVVGIALTLVGYFLYVWRYDSK